MLCQSKKHCRLDFNKFGPKLLDYLSIWKLKLENYDKTFKHKLEII